jgi:hypothetical protein
MIRCAQRICLLRAPRHPRAVEVVAGEGGGGKQMALVVTGAEGQRAHLKVAKPDGVGAGTELNLREQVLRDALESATTFRPHR